MRQLQYRCHLKGACAKTVLYFVQAEVVTGGYHISWHAITLYVRAILLFLPSPRCCARLCLARRNRWHQTAFADKKCTYCGYMRGAVHVGFYTEKGSTRATDNDVSVRPHA